jgi:O-antigen/teichoic acid export membrane protein
MLRSLLPKIYMALSLSVRMFVGLAIFALLARGLGPKEFGLVSLVFSYASLASLLTDFGLALKTLRDIAERPEHGRAILRATLKIKSAFSLGVCAIGTCIIVYLPMTLEVKSACVALSAGVMIASFGDLALVAFRATNRFGGESWIVVWTSLLYGGSLVPILFLGGQIFAVSIGFLVCRSIFAAVALREAMKILPVEAASADRPKLYATVRSALSWAMLSNLSYVNGQIDGALVAPLLGLHDTGIYQSGAKFVGSAITFASVITNTQVPRIAAAAGRKTNTLTLEMMAWLQMLAVGAVFSWIIYLGGPLITRYLIGAKYAEVNQLWLGFGVLTFARFVSSSILVSLVALNRATTNLIGEAATTIVTIPLMFWLVPHYGLSSVPWIMSAGAVATSVALILGRCHFHFSTRQLATSSERQREPAPT